MGGFASNMIKSIEEEYCFDEKYKNRPAIKPLSDITISKITFPRAIYDDDSMLRRRMMVKEFRSQRKVKLPPINTTEKNIVKTTHSEGSVGENDLEEALFETLKETRILERKKLVPLNESKLKTDGVYYFG